MNKSALLLCGLVIALTSSAEEPSLRLDAGPSKWSLEPRVGEEVIIEKTEPASIPLGKTDFVVSGPVIEALRARAYKTERNLGQKILGLPIIRLFVPQRMPSPPTSGGSYFAWRGTSTRPWVETVSGGAGVPGATGLVNHEPQTSLISLGRASW